MQLFPIYMKTLTGKTVELRITNDTTVGEIKAMIQDLHGIPPDQQRLCYLGNQLAIDKHTASHCKIETGSTIHLILRLTGCACGCGLYPPWADESTVVKSEDGVTVTASA